MDNELTLAEIRERRRMREAERFPAEFEEPDFAQGKTRGDYIVRLILLQTLLCALLVGAVFLLQHAAPAQFAQLRESYHALMETDMTAGEIFAALKKSAAFVFAPAEDFLRAKPVDGDADIKPSGKNESTTAADTTTATETTLPSGGEDIDLLAAQRQVSFAPVYLTAAPVLPVSGRISSRFGYRVHPVTGEEGVHAGLDIAAPEGTPIAAAFSGTVTFAGKGEINGNYLRLRHSGGLETVYAHCSELYVSEGIHVRAGEIIALVGETGLTTGPHLHFELYADGLRRNPEWVLPL